MSNLYEQNIKKLEEISIANGYYMSLGSLFGWDQWMGLPPKGLDYRSEVQGFFTSQHLNMLTSKDTVKLLEFFEDKEFKNDIHKSIFKQLKKIQRLPTNLMAQLDRITIQAQAAWYEAYQKSDFEIFKPYLEDVINLNKKIAEHVNSDGHLMNGLVSQYEMDLTVEEITEIFDELKVGLIKLIKKIQSSNVKIKDIFENLEYEKEDLIDFAKYVVETMGYDAQAGAYGEVLHPYASTIGPHDCRVTANYSNFKNIYGTIHESGHSIYALNTSDEIAKLGMWGGLSGSLHESQALFYENIIGQSMEFCSYFYPELQKRFPYFKDISLQEYYNSINIVKPYYKRIESDEVSYNLHPIIRFEIEKDIIEEKIKIDDIREIWNAKYKEYLGLNIKNDREGVLQDVHWSLGVIGFFQSYTLGNVYGGQYLNTLLKDVPNVYKEIEGGNFNPLNSWLKENIHQYGRVYTPTELLVKTTGKKLKAKYYLEYLNKKYSDIYNL